MSHRYYLCCGDNSQRAQLKKGLELLRQCGQRILAEENTIRSSINVTELILNPDLPSADTILRAMATAAGVCLIQK